MKYIKCLWSLCTFVLPVNGDNKVFKRDVDFELGPSGVVILSASFAREFSSFAVGDAVPYNAIALTHFPYVEATR